MSVQQALEWAFRVEHAQLELPEPPDPEREQGFGFGLEYVLLQRAILGCKVDGGQYKIGSYTHEDAEPPDGPKGLDRIMQRAAKRKADEKSRGRRKTQKPTKPERQPITDLPAFYADWVNSEKYLPSSAISNSIRDQMLARGLVTPQQLRERGVQ